MSTGPETASPSLQSAHTVVSLTFDDVLADQAQVGAMAAAHGFHATFYVNSGRLGQSGHMTLAQVTALQAAGNEIGGHTVDHANLPTLSDADARREICDDRVTLLGDGFVVTNFAYPFGATDASVRQIVMDCGYNSARLVGGLVNPDSCRRLPVRRHAPPADPSGSAPTTR